MFFLLWVVIKRNDNKFTQLEAEILDLAFILHAEHGGGNNSTFTTHLVSSSGTDTYSAIAAAIGSLKGPKHGGANIKVRHMFNDMKTNVSDWKDDEEIADYSNYTPTEPKEEDLEEDDSQNQLVDEDKLYENN